MSKPSNPFDPGGELGSDWSQTPVTEAPHAEYEDKFTSPVLISANPSVPILVSLAADAAFNKALAEFNEKTKLHLTKLQAFDLIKCAGISNLFRLGLIANLYEKAARNELDLHEIEPCTLLWLARMGVCYTRIVKENPLLADVFSFWLEGKGADQANLTREEFQLHPFDPLSKATLDYYPLDMSYFLKELNSPGWAQIDAELKHRHYDVIVNSICKRLHAQPSALFPPASAHFVHQKVPLHPEPNGLLINGEDWLLYEMTFEISTIKNINLYLFAGMALLSRVKVSARETQGPDPATGETDDGWEVSIDEWWIRIWDYIDFHADKRSRVQVGEMEVFFDDSVVFPLRDGQCAEATATDYLALTTNWRQMPVATIGKQRFFLSKATTCAMGDNQTPVSPAP